jgi:hypothetical protein
MRIQSTEARSLRVAMLGAAILWSCLGTASPSDRVSSPQASLRADFSLTFLEAFFDHVAPGTIGYRFRVGISSPAAADESLAARLPDGCRRQKPFNCTWQLVFGGETTTAELYLPADLAPGTYVFGFTLRDGRSADAQFSVVPAGERSLSVQSSGPAATTSPGVPRAEDACPSSVAKADGRGHSAGALRLASDFGAICGAGQPASTASIAVGSRELLVATSETLALYTKDGSVLDHVPTIDMFSSLVRTAGYGWSHPRVSFDQTSGRYLLALNIFRAVPRVGACECELRWLIAVSRTSSPGSLRAPDWYLYAFDGTLENGKPSDTSTGDFLVLGADSSNIVVQGRMAKSHAAETSFTKLWVFDKERLLRGETVSGPDKEFIDPRDPLTGESLIRLLPAVAAENPGRVFLAGRSGSGCSIVVAAVSGTGSKAELTMRAVPVGGSCAAPPHSPQRGAGTPIWSVGDVLAPPSYADGRLWLAHAVGLGASGRMVGAIRLVEIDVRGWPATPSVLSESMLSAPDVWYSFPAIVSNKRNDVAIVATRSSFSEYGSVSYTGRVGGDVSGILRPPVMLRPGEANWNQLARAPQPAGPTYNVFADYSGAAIDPSDGTAWVVGTYVANVCAWGTWVGHLDWSVASVEVLSSGVPPPPKEGPPCQPPPSTLFTLRFVSVDAAGPVAGPAASRPYVFDFSGPGLDDLRNAMVISPVSDANWVLIAPGRIAVFLPSGRVFPGSAQLRIRLPDGRETGAYFTVPPEN